MSAELFKAMTKCDMVHVPYRGCCAAEKVKRNQRRTA
jgi:hypothetical protein